MLIKRTGGNSCLWCSSRLIDSDSTNQIEQAYEAYNKTRWSPLVFHTVRDIETKDITAAGRGSASTTMAGKPNEVNAATNGDRHSNR